MYTSCHQDTYERSSILLIQSCAMDIRGGVLSLLRVLAQLKTKVSLLGVTLPQYSHTLVLDRGGIASGGVLSLLGLFA